jgi:HAD superfamily hydrolase (TIGR01509 family)
MTTLTVTPAQAGAQAAVLVTAGHFVRRSKFALDHGGIRAAFPVIVSTQDVRQGKPHPEAFLTALANLNQLRPIPDPLLAPSDCVVIEDAPRAAEAARTVG